MAFVERRKDSRGYERVGYYPDSSVVYKAFEELINKVPYSIRTTFLAHITTAVVSTQSRGQRGVEYVVTPIRTKLHKGVGGAVITFLGWQVRGDGQVLGRGAATGRPAAQPLGGVRGLGRSQASEGSPDRWPPFKFLFPLMIQLKLGLVRFRDLDNIFNTYWDLVERQSGEGSMTAGKDSMIGAVYDSIRTGVATETVNQQLQQSGKDSGVDFLRKWLLLYGVSANGYMEAVKTLRDLLSSSDSGVKKDLREMPPELWDFVYNSLGVLDGPRSAEEKAAAMIHRASNGAELDWDVLEPLLLESCLPVQVDDTHSDLVGMNFLDVVGQTAIGDEMVGNLASSPSFSEALKKVPAAELLSAEAMEGAGRILDRAGVGVEQLAYSLGRYSRAVTGEAVDQRWTGGGVVNQEITRKVVLLLKRCGVMK